MELALCLTTDADNPVQGDLLLTNGDLVFTSDLGQEVAQRLRVRFNFWRKEWFLNLNAGTPYLEAVFEKGVPDNTIRAVFTQIILGTKGVSAVDSLDFVFDSERLMILTFVCRLEDGTRFSSNTYGPFVVSIAA